MLYYVLWVSAWLFNKGRLPRNCIASMWLSVKFSDAIPRNDGGYSVGIKNNPRATDKPKSLRNLATSPSENFTNHS